MTVRDETGTWNVFDGYEPGGAKLDLNVTAVGTAELDTYVNNELLDVAKIGVEPPRSSIRRRRRRHRADADGQARAVAALGRLCRHRRSDPDGRERRAPTRCTSTRWTAASFPNFTWGPKIVGDLRKLTKLAVRLPPDDRRAGEVRRRFPRRPAPTSSRFTTKRRRTRIACCSTCARSARAPVSASTRKRRPPCWST